MEGDEFSAGCFSRGGKILGGELVSRNFTLGEFTSILIQFFFMSCFPFSVSILGVELLKVIVRGKVLPGLNCREAISVGDSFLPGCGARFPGIILKRSEIKLKKSFFN